ncbi:GNAT family N-acetyltransferase [Deinococcus rubellus]|uniref:GNAT family N-acetyltransferase n=1 Tax=Deinococcus rubellus TaxID=1889240 RepID=A0ABY5YDQ5_9DEIO|nr:GNAT family N-acetyltransferase [Deinococcus rubellus]UWX63197.1 GNAT family N-acetyltransferase [Deinococcus rubellus]
MSLPDGFTLRSATLVDAETIQAQRDAMFADIGSGLEQIQAVSASSLTWLRRTLASGAYHGLLLEHGGQIVAGAGAQWQEFQPSPKSPSSVRAYLDNVYVAPQQRGQGLAGQLVRALLAECLARGVDLVSLHASDAGRATYTRLGFKPTPELRLLFAEAGL